ncbi:MAG: AmmeMemoRadiSam system protein B [Georgfuchsia sp.]
MMLRPPAVAGLFYPGQRKELGVDVSTLIDEAYAECIIPKALIVPHAGYIYSGPVAASAYATLQPQHADIRRVVLLGPVHRVPVVGLAATSAAAFETPLGKVNVDRAAIEQALRLPQVTINDQAHAQEHSLEVHLPFLQTVLDDFSIVPFAVGDATAKEVAEVLELLWGGDETLILISSDLSHYHPYAAARQLDQATADSILRLDLLTSHEQACGATPINGLLATAPRHRLKPQLLDLRNSGDTAGDKSRVVGYGSFAFSEDHG